MKFEVYKDGKLCKEYRPQASYMFGADTVPLHATKEISVDNGVIDCRRKSHDSAGFVTLWPVSGHGELLLPTTRLPERKDPYIMNVEMARARLMQIALKSEDWASYIPSHKINDLTSTAKEMFIESLKHISQPSEASKYADSALEKAVELSESIAIEYAEQLFTSRCTAKNKTLNRHSLGCQVDLNMIEDKKYRKWLFDMFGFVTIPVNWATIETEQGQYDFTLLDKCFNNLTNRRIIVCAGPLLRFSRDYLPGWLINSKWKFEKIREAAYGFISKVISRYSQYVHMWRVISGMNSDNYFGFSFEQAIEMTRTACLAGRSADPKSRKMVEILYPWGEYYARDRSTVPPLVYADTLIQSGISFDAVSMIIQLGIDRPGFHVRDLMQISSRLDCMAQVSRPVHISGVEIPDADTEMTRCAGQWRKKWDQDLQADWIDNFYRIVLSKGFINTVTYNHLVDRDQSDIPNSGLITRHFEPKKSLLAIARLQKRILNK